MNTLISSQYTQRYYLWTAYKTVISSRNLLVQYEDDGTKYCIWGYDGPEVHLCYIYKGAAPDAVVASGYDQGTNDADRADFETSFKTNANKRIDTKSTTIVAQPDPAPFAQPTFRTKRTATADIVTISPGGDADTQFKLMSERYVSGGSLVIENAEFGDYVIAEVEDVDGVIPAPYRAALCENWPIVATYIEKEYVEVITPGSLQVGSVTVHKIDTAPLNAKITAGLYLCVHYYAVSGGLNRRTVVNYHLTKKL